MQTSVDRVRRPAWFLVLSLTPTRWGAFVPEFVLMLALLVGFPEESVGLRVIAGLVLLTVAVWVVPTPDVPLADDWWASARGVVAVGVASVTRRIVDNRVRRTAVRGLVQPASGRPPGRELGPL